MTRTDPILNGAQAHLLINHLPVLVPLVGLALVLAGLILRSPVTRQAGLWVFVLGALFSIPTYLTGEPAESVVKNYPGPTRDLIHQHEAAALPALFDLCATGFCAAITLVVLHKGKSIPKSAWVGLLLLMGLSFAMIARVAHLGGQIRHEEIEDLETLQPPL